MGNFIHGFLVCAGLIVSIGAQNAFLLKQGLLRQHVFLVAMTCFICDVVLFGVGILGFSTLLNQAPIASVILAFFGAAFLFLYGARTFLSAYKRHVCRQFIRRQTNPIRAQSLFIYTRHHLTQSARLFRYRCDYRQYRRNDCRHGRQNFIYDRREHHFRPLVFWRRLWCEITYSVFPQTDYLAHFRWDHRNYYVVDCIKVNQIWRGIIVIPLRFLPAELPTPYLRSAIASISMPTSFGKRATNARTRRKIRMFIFFKKILIFRIHRRKII